MIKYSSSHLIVREGRDLSGESGQYRAVDTERTKKETLFVQTGEFI